MPNNQKSTDTMNQRELLIRLDERVRTLVTQMTTIQSGLISKTEYLEMVRKVDEHDKRLDVQEKFQDRILTYLAIVGSVSGVVVAFLADFIKGLIFKQ